MAGSDETVNGLISTEAPIDYERQIYNEADDAISLYYRYMTSV